MNKKGVAGYVAGIIGLVVMVILATSALLPSVNDTTQVQSVSETLEHDSSTFENSTPLSGVTSSDTVTGISITGLTSPGNYSLDTDLQQVNWTNATADGNYSATVSYTAATYLSNTRDRAIMAIAALLVVAGLVFAIGRLFGML